MLRRIAPLCFAALFACSDPPAPAPTPDARASKARLDAHMEDHLAHARAGLAAVVEGDVAEFRGEAQWLADNPFGGDEVPEPWKARAAAVQVAATVASKAPDLDQAAAGIVGIAAACGACHEAAGAVQSYPLPPRPPRAEGVAMHMARHAWGLDRLWEALTGPSEESWKAGHSMLAERSLEPGEVEHHELPPDAVELEGRIHALAAEALTLTDPTRRRVAVADMLKACAACHVKTGGGPGWNPKKPMAMPAGEDAAPPAKE